MGYREFVRDLFGMPRPQAAQFSSLTVSQPKVIDAAVKAGWFGYGPGSVSRTEALTVPAVLKARNLVCGIATLPLEVRDSSRNLVRSPFLEQIDPDVPNAVTMSQTLEDLYFEGTSFWRVTTWADGDRIFGRPMSAYHVPWQTVTLQTPAGRTPSPLPSGLDPRGAQVWLDGEPVDWAEIIMFSSLNPGLLRSCGPVVRRALDLANTAGVYANNPRPMDYFTPKEGWASLTEEKVELFLVRHNYLRKKFGTGWYEGVDYNTVDVPTPVEMQLVEQQKQVYLELAAAMNLDPEDLGISTTSRTYQNDVSRRQDTVNRLLLPYMTAIEQRLSMPDVTPRGQKVRFDLDDYLRPDPKTRAEVDEIRLRNQTTTQDEIREDENMPDIPVSQRPVVESSPAGIAAARFSAEDPPDSAMFAFDDTPAVTVDAQRRTITGLVVPFGKVALSGGRRFSFGPGSIQFADLSYIKLLRDHDWSQPLGKATSWTETEQGIFATFKVAHGPEGDRALALAEDGALDGLSVNVDPIHDAIPDPNNRGAWLVRRSTAREVSLTARPAFDSARVTSVKASRDEGSNMDDATTEPQAPAAPAVAPEPLDPQYAAFMAWQKQQQLTGAPPEPEPRPVINPVRQTAATFVRESHPYKFDRQGNFVDSEHILSMDMRKMARANDTHGTETDAGRRVMDFLRADFAATFATTVTTDVNETNYPINIPSAYVDQRDYRTPLWNSVNKGALPNKMQPFLFPKYASNETLVADHVEGTEPTPGKLVTTSQTVEPSAYSGKSSITREVWEMGGNPQVSTLIRNQMARSVREYLESATATFLNTLTAAEDINLGVGSSDAAFIATWEGALTDLQFIRGYDFDFFAAEKWTYKKFAAAKYSSGEPAYPMINPQNRNGTSERRFQTLDAGGVIVIPTWALTAVSGSANNSWLYDPTTVFGWATGPEYLEFPGTASGGGYAPVAMVDIGVFGYKAFANTDIGGVRQVIYDTN